MKKKLEADLISIAHRILQMKNKSDINQLCIETQKLYEKLSVLRFVEEHFGDAKPTIGQAEIVEKMNQIFEENHLLVSKPIQVQAEVVAEEVPVDEIITEESIIEEVVVDGNEENEEIFEEEVVSESSEEVTKVDFLPAFELDDVEEEKKGVEEKISFMDLLGEDYSETMFVKVDQSQEKSNPLDFELPKETNLQSKSAKHLPEIQASSKDIEPKTAAVLENQIKIISIGLNDRIAFVKHLFGNNDADYSRVLNQLITYDSFEEAKNLIEDMVKPDYDNWEGKEDYEQRFLEIIEKKFA
jgi:hypothetical protein